MKPYKYKKYLTVKFSLLFLWFSIVYSQDTNYQFKHLSPSDGLSQSSAIAIEQDSLGQIWVGTRDGLNSYNGTKFTVFRNDPKSKSSISNNDILSLEVDRSGHIWIGTHNGLNRYDPAKNVFKTFFHNSTENSLSNNIVEVVKEMNNGEIWLATNNGLSIYNKDTNTFINVFHNQHNPQSISGNHIKSILESRDGTIWLGTTAGLSKLVAREKDSLLFKNFYLNKTNTKYDEPIVYQDIIQGYTDKQLLIGTNANGVLKFDIATEELTPFFSRKEQKSIYKDVRELMIDSSGSLWVGTYFGLNIVTKDRKISKLLHEPTEPNSLSKNSIKCFYTDKKGSVWVGTYYGGINIWDNSNVNYLNYNQNKGRTGLNYDVVSSITHDGKDQIYFGTEGGGINVLNKRENRIWYINKSNFRDLPDDNIKSLLLLNEENLWVGTYKAGIALYNIKKNKFENHNIPDNLKKSVKATPIFSIKQGGNKFIWLGTWGKGLIRYNIEKKDFTTYLHDTSNSKSLSNNFIRSILVDSKDNVWVGTQSGLNVISKDVGVERYFFNNETRFGDDILCVFEDNNNQIWVGTRSKGLFMLNEHGFDAIDLVYKNKKVMTINGILEDDKNLWISSNQGLIKFNPKNKDVLIYDINDGLISNEFNDNSCLKVGNSMFYYGGPAGVTSFNSEKISTNVFSPQVVISNLKINGKSVTVNENQSILNKSISYTESIELLYDQVNFGLEFAIPNFINPGSNLYQYRLLGLTENWTTTDQAEVNYTVQKPGNYVFEVKGANNDGVWNTSVTRLLINVKPAPWRSIWAFILYGILIFGVLLGLGKMIRSQAKLKHKLQLEHLESIRKQEINDAKLQFFTNISHEFRTPLTLITGPLQQLLSDYKGSSFVYKKLMVIESNAKHLLQLINRLMDFRKLEHKKFKLEAAEGNIIKFVKEIYLSFKEFAKVNGYEYSFYAEEDEIFVYYDRIKLEQVFYNLISNAFKYTPVNGCVSIDVRKAANYITIDIKDTGQGIPEKYRDKVFDRFFEIPNYRDTKTAPLTGTGIGLSIAKNIIDLHQGSISVMENSDVGSVFRVILPLGKAHLDEDQLVKNFKYSDDISLYTSQKSYLSLRDRNKIKELLIDTYKDTILLVEDNVHLRKFMKDLLNDDYNVIEAGNGKEAFKKALQHLPQLIVSDVIMPVMVGTELCAKIKENIKTSHIPVVLLTSRTSLLYKFEGLESGADDYISKPFDVREFQLRIKNLIDSSNRLRNKFSEEHDFIPNEMVITSVDENLLRKALKIVDENIANDQFDIPTFSSELGVSRTLLFTKIKAWTNFTPNEFIQEIRMNKAAQLLEKDKLNIAQVCYKVGFKNPKYFSKRFHKKFGMSPTEYIEKFSKNLL